MPLTAELQARLARRGLLNRAEKGIIANYMYKISTLVLYIISGCVRQFIY